MTPCFSPDGSRIAFSSDKDGEGASDIYMMFSDGTQQARLTFNANFDFSPTFRSDGLIAYVTDHAFSLNSEIFVMNPDGTGQTNLSNNAADESSPGFAGPVTMPFMP